MRGRRPREGREDPCGQTTEPSEEPFIPCPGILRSVRIFPTLLAAFVVIPLVEIALFVVASDRMGIWPTLFVVIVTAFVGASLVSRQGRGAMAAVQREFLGGRFPAKELAHGAMILVSGALLVTPGFLTDIIGFSLLVPAIRELIRRWGVRRYQSNVIVIEE